MYVDITKPKSNGQKMTAVFYDYENIPIKTVYFGASCHDDYTVLRSR